MEMSKSTSSQKAQLKDTYLTFFILNEKYAYFIFNTGRYLSKIIKQTLILRSLDQDIQSCYKTICNTRLLYRAYCTSCTWPCTRSQSRSLEIELQRARAKLEVSNVFYAFFILKQKNVKYGVFYYFSAVSFNYALSSAVYQASLHACIH